MDFRSHKPSDAPAIESLFRSVFTESEGEQEGDLVGDLARELMATTDSKDLYGFVAVEGEQIVGAVFFSRLTFETDVDAFILAPVAVRTDRQSKGIGQELIRHGLRGLEKQEIRFVATYGDPAYYSKVSFRPISQDAIRAPFELSQPEGWLGQSLTGAPVEEMLGECKCVAALNDPVYW